MNELTDEQLNKWGHELLGLCWHSESKLTSIRPDEDRFEWYFRCECGRSSSAIDNNGLDIPDRPNYCNDLNACRLVEMKVLTEAGLRKYGDAMRKETLKVGITASGKPIEELLALATAKQRMTACYKAMMEVKSYE